MSARAIKEYIGLLHYLTLGVLDLVDRFTCYCGLHLWTIGMEQVNQVRWWEIRCSRCGKIFRDTIYILWLH